MLPAERTKCTRRLSVMAWKRVETAGVFLPGTYIALYVECTRRIYTGRFSVTAREYIEETGMFLSGVHSAIC